MCIIIYNYYIDTVTIENQSEITDMIGMDDNHQVVEEPCEVETLTHGFVAERRRRLRRLGIR